METPISFQRNQVVIFLYPGGFLACSLVSWQIHWQSRGQRGLRHYWLLLCGSASVGYLYPGMYFFFFCIVSFVLLFSSCLMKFTVTNIKKKKDKKDCYICKGFLSRIHQVDGNNIHVLLFRCKHRSVSCPTHMHVYVSFTTKISRCFVTCQHTHL